MDFFKAITDLIPESGSVQMAITKRNGMLTVSIVPTFEDKGCRLVPLTMTASPAQLDTELPTAICQYTPSVQRLSNTLEQAKIAADAVEAERKAKAEKASKSKPGKKATPATPVEDSDSEGEAEDIEPMPVISKVERKKGVSDPAHVATLAKESSTSPAFLSTLTGASAQTMLDALNVPELVDVKAISLIAMELADVIEKADKDILRGILSHKYKQTQNGVREKIGKALEETTGKTLEELGLAAKQFSLIG